MDSDKDSPYTREKDGASYCYYCGSPPEVRHGSYCPHRAPASINYARNADGKLVCVECGSPEEAYHNVGCSHSRIPKFAEGGIITGNPDRDMVPLAFDNSYVIPKRRVDSVTHTHGGTDAPECTTCEGQPGYVEPDMVNHPAHYNSGPKCSCGKTIECIDITRHYSLLRGTAMKYLWRADYKGSKVEDLKKSLWYIQKEIDSLEDW